MKSRSLASTLFELVRAKKGGANSRVAGYKFEDLTAMKIYSFAREYGFEAFQPRYTIPYPTLSGAHHQFDACYKEGNTFHVFECKKIKIPLKQHIYYFNSKIFDYVLAAWKSGSDFRIKGTFLSTVDVGDSVMAYALSYGLTVIDPSSPPIEYMLRSDINPKLRRTLRDFKVSLPQSLDVLKRKTITGKTGKELCSEYRFLVKRWMEEIGEK